MSLSLIGDPSIKVKANVAERSHLLNVEERLTTEIQQVKLDFTQHMEACMGHSQHINKLQTLEQQVQTLVTTLSEVQHENKSLRDELQLLRNSLKDILDILIPKTRTDLKEPLRTEIADHS